MFSPKIFPKQTIGAILCTIICAILLKLFD